MPRLATTSTLLLATLALSLLSASATHAQIDYDAAHNAYFVTGDASINTDISGNEVMVGKDNATDMTTLPGAITLNVEAGAIITGLGNYYGLSYFYGVSVFGDHRANINGGTVQFVAAFDTSVLNINGGTVGNPIGYMTSVVNINGGTVKDTYSSDTSVVNINGGAVDGAVGNVTGVVNINGGSVKRAASVGASVLNISGGTVNYVAGTDTGTVNLIGGSVGGIDGNVNDSNYIGVYLTSGALNLYGSNFTRTDITDGSFTGQNGTYSTLSGTLLDGSSLNTTFFLANGVTYEDLGGGTQDNPLLPDSNGDGIFTFEGVPSGAWFDPPSVDAFLFTMIDGHRFTDILDFPTGFDGPFTVSVNGTVLGEFGPGQAVDFAAFGFGEGVPSFTISGIEPQVDAENPLGFPIRLGFSSTFASFTMQGINVSAAAPEPGSLGFVLIGVSIVAFFAARRRGI